MQVSVKICCITYDNGGRSVNCSYLIDLFTKEIIYNVYNETVKFKPYLMINSMREYNYAENTQTHIFHIDFFNMDISLIMKLTSMKTAIHV